MGGLGRSPRRITGCGNRGRLRDQRALVAIGALLIVAIALFGLINKFTEYKKHPLRKQVSQTERYERRGRVLVAVPKQSAPLNERESGSRRLDYDRRHGGFRRLGV